MNKLPKVTGLVQLDVCTVGQYLGLPMEGDIGQRDSVTSEKSPVRKSREAELATFRVAERCKSKLSSTTSSGGMSHTSANPYSDLSSFLQPLRIGIDTLYELSYRLSLTYRKLAASPEHFFPTPITRLPTGLETGRYLAVYVGLSYLRVAFIDLLGDQQRVRRTLEKAWPIEEHLRRDRAPDLFTFIGDCIADVVRDSLNSPTEEVPRELTTGISFCFPIR